MIIQTRKCEILGKRKNIELMENPHKVYESLRNFKNERGSKANFEECYDDEDCIEELICRYKSPSSAQG